MVSKRQAAANRANAARSTGPRTAAGKAKAKMNPVTHGLRSEAPVVPGERAEDFEAFRAAFVADLDPVGAVETEQAERVARLSWRLRRVERHEVAMTVVEQDAAAATAREMFAPDTGRWTNAALRAALRAGPEGDGRGAAGPDAEPAGAAARTGEEIARAEAAARAATVLPAATVLDVVARYESHLNRELTRALYLLKSLQQDRLRKSGSGAPEAPALGPAGRRRG